MLEAALSDEGLIGGIELSTLLLVDAKAIGLPLAIYYQTTFRFLNASFCPTICE
jgi:hypothetical protein